MSAREHSTAFDVEAHRNGRTLAQAKGFLDVHEEAYAVPARRERSRRRASALRMPSGGTSWQESSRASCACRRW